MYLMSFKKGLLVVACTLVFLVVGCGGTSTSDSTSFSTTSGGRSLLGGGDAGGIGPHTDDVGAGTGVPVVYNPGSTPSPPQPSIFPQYFYVANNGDTQQGAITAFQLAKDGVLTRIPGNAVYTFPIGSQPAATFQTPDGRFVYSINEQTLDISLLRVTGSTGMLTADANRIDPDLGLLSGMTFGTFGGQTIAYALGENGLKGYTVNATDGTLTDLFSTIDTELSAVMAPPVLGGPGGRYLYVVGWTSSTPASGEALVYPVQTDGSLGSATRIDLSGSQPDSLAFSADGKFAYMGDSRPSTGSMLGFRVGSTGDLTPLTPVELGVTSPGQSIRALETKPVLYTTINDFSSPHTLLEFSIGADGRLTPMGTHAFMNPVSALMFDLSESYLYAMSGMYGQNDTKLSFFDVGTDGRLSPRTSQDVVDPSLTYWATGHVAVVASFL